jgi:hypothetical protein
MDNGHEPATKQDLAILRSEMSHQFDDLKETFRDSQTELLKAFYSFAESNQKRLAEMETESAAIKSRLATIEDRLLQVERKVNFPNPPSQ